MRRAAIRRALLFRLGDFRAVRMSSSNASGKRQPRGSSFGKPMQAGDTLLSEIEEAHKKACVAKQQMYIDPSTGYSVFTEIAHTNRGYCCGNCCRHCPFAHTSVKDPSLRTNEIVKPTLIKARGKTNRSPAISPNSNNDKLHVLFWSGGKDSFMALRALQRQLRGLQSRIVLLTTFDQNGGKVAFQNTNVRDIVAQAAALQLDVLVIPLLGGEATTAVAPYVTTVMDALKILEGEIEALCFGDLHLADIRQWREETFSPFYPCKFPIFGRPYASLMEELETARTEEGVRIEVCAVRDDLQRGDNTVDDGYSLQVGRQFCASFVELLPVGVDAMGENGEFHTHVTFPVSSKKQQPDVQVEEESVL